MCCGYVVDYCEIRYVSLREKTVDRAVRFLFRRFGVGPSITASTAPEALGRVEGFRVFNDVANLPEGIVGVPLREKQSGVNGLKPQGALVHLCFSLRFVTRFSFKAFKA